MKKDLLTAFENLIKPHPLVVEDFKSSPWKAMLDGCAMNAQRGLITQYMNQRLQMANTDTMSQRTHLYKDGPDKDYIGAIKKKMMRTLVGVVGGNEKTN